MPENLDRLTQGVGGSATESSAGSAPGSPTQTPSSSGAGVVRVSGSRFEVRVNVSTSGALYITADSLEQAQEIADDLEIPEVEIYFGGERLEDVSSDLCVYSVELSASQKQRYAAPGIDGVCDAPLGADNPHPNLPTETEPRDKQQKAVTE